ncbi:MAG TPA: Hint domain-containing protein [Acetobacteraceae bacterium]
MTADPSFAAGTRIATTTGEIPVEDLRIGDMPLGPDGLPRRLSAIGLTAYSPRALATNSALRPVRIGTGALGGIPSRDLMLGPAVRIRLSCGTAVPAWLLVDDTRITREIPASTLRLYNLTYEGPRGVVAEGLAADTAPEADLATILQARARLASASGFSPGRLRGLLDKADRMSVSGWARDEDHPDRPVALELRFGDASAGPILACRARDDLAEARLGDCAFRLVLPTPLDPARAHVLRMLRMEDGMPLPGPAMLLDRAAPLAALLAALDRGAVEDLRKLVEEFGG